MVMDGGSVLVGSTGPASQQAPNSGSPGVTSQSVVPQLPDNANNGQPSQNNQNQPGGQNPDAMRVAREFVRQYYTIMHESPIHLHRFYNDESDFIHGGIGASQAAKAVRGQHEIHRTIMNLNFRDCYVKILYVDAQESVNQSVVVQVAGELSNQGNPMRRFLQTFVLVPIMARKYYVRNDIFRYQDEIFEDPADGEEDIGVEQRGSTPTAIPISTPAATSTAASHSQSNNGPAAAVIMNGQVPDSPVNNNNNVHEMNGIEEIKEKSEEKRGKEWIPPIQNMTSNSAAHEDGPQVVQSNASVTQVAPTPQPAAPTPPQPKSWSQMVQNKTEPPTAAVPQSNQPTFTTPSAFGGNLGNSTGSNSAGLSQRTPRPAATNNRQQNGGTALPNSVSNNNVNNAQSGVKKDLKPQIGSMCDDSAQGDVNNSAQNSFTPDNHQLFVGNIPIQVSEKQLKDFFASYGLVQDFRLSTNKASGNGKGPNYGFVIFDSPETVQKVLQNRPIYWDSENKMRLNVEEKKPRTHKTGGGGGGNGGSRGGNTILRRPPMMNGRNGAGYSVPRGSGDRMRQTGTGQRTAIPQH